MMRRAIAVFGFVSTFTLAAASFTVLPSSPSRAAGGNPTFLIPASDGYGVAECLTGGTDCGVIVANAWCEAHGFSRADAFGPAAEDVTGSTEPTITNSVTRAARPVAISCVD